MTKNQLSFFATRADLESLLRAVESKRPLQFIIAGLFDSPELKRMQSLVSALNFGLVSTGHPNQEPTYLVADREAQIEVRMVPQRRGGIRYAVDQQANPKTIAFRLGGEFGEGFLIAGQLGTVSDDPTSLEMFRFFSREMRHQFTKIKSEYVGKQAEELLDKGWRLTGNAKSPPVYDLKRD